MSRPLGSARRTTRRLQDRTLAGRVHCRHCEALFWETWTEGNLPLRCLSCRLPMVFPLCPGIAGEN